MKKLKTKLEFQFDIDEEIPSLNYEIPLENNKKKSTKINIQRKKKNVRDTSTNKLF